MKIGLCTQPAGDGYRVASDAGADYTEVSAYALMKNTKEEAEAMLRTVREIGLPVTRSNGLFPSNIVLVGPERTERGAVADYLERTFARLTEFGVEIAVWGSGGGRRIPEGYAEDRAHSELLESARLIGDTAAKFGLKIAVEPLNRRETNTFCTVKETADFVRELCHPCVRLLADSYHMAAESEPYDSLGAYKDVLIHCHLAEAKFGSADIRRLPGEADEFGISAFVRALRDIGYEGGVSLEAGARTGDWLSDARSGLATLRRWATE